MASFARTLLSLAQVLSVFALVGAVPASAKVFQPETVTLPNGLQVVVTSNHRAPVVTHMLWYRVGAIDEPPGLSGLAHLLEHLMFKGTQTLAPGEFSAIVARNGGQENAFTSWDYTGYHQSVAKDRLATMMQIEADRMANLALTDAVIKPELLVVLEERNTRVGNDPSARLGEQVNASFFMNHPYRIPIIGWEEEIARLSRPEIEAFYRDWYAPNNAILVVSGDVTMAEVLPLAEKYYGPIPPRALPARVAWAEPPLVADSRLVLRHPQVRQPAWSRQYRAPSYMNGATEHAYALQVLSEILSGGTNSRLYRSLVIDAKVAVSAGSWYEPNRRGPTSFGFFLSPPTENELVAAEQAMEAEIAKVVADGVTEAEVSAAVQRLRDSVVYALDSYRTPARVLGAALAVGQRVEDVEAWPERIAAVRAADVNAAVAVVLGGTRSVTSLLLPDETGVARRGDEAPAADVPGAAGPAAAPAATEEPRT